jgi:hypothetical protein
MKSIQDMICSAVKTLHMRDAATVQTVLRCDLTGDVLRKLLLQDVTSSCHTVELLPTPILLLHACLHA